MRQFLLLLGHELRALLLAPSTYVASVLFLGLMGYLYFYLVQDYVRMEQDVALPEVFFQSFALPALFLVPLLTMRSVAEERRLGTLESLLSTPVSAAGIVLAKYAAAYGFYLTLWLLTTGFPLLTVWAVGAGPAGAQLFEPGPLIGGYLYVACSGLLFTAVGLFTSCLTRSQFVAGMLSFSILFIVILGLPALQQPAAEWSPGLAPIFDYLQLRQHLEDFCRGVLDTRPLAYYGSSTLLVLGLSILTVEGRP